MMDQTESNPLPCDGKMVFSSKDDAQNMAVAVDWQRGNKLKAYRCKHCQLWHLSSAAKDNDD